MTYLLDTNVCSAHMRRPAGLAHRFIQHSGRLYVPSIVLAELYAGAYCHPSPAKFLGPIADLLKDLTVIDVDRDCPEKYGIIKGELAKKGHRLPFADLMIAAVALERNLYPCDQQHS